MCLARLWHFHYDMRVIFGSTYILFIFIRELVISCNYKILLYLYKSNIIKFILIMQN